MSSSLQVKPLHCCKTSSVSSIKSHCSNILNVQFWTFQYSTSLGYLLGEVNGATLFQCLISCFNETSCCLTMKDRYCFNFYCHNLLVFNVMYLFNLLKYAFIFTLPNFLLTFCWISTNGFLLKIVYKKKMLLQKMASHILLLSLPCLIG